MILLISTKLDAHADAIEEALKELGQEDVFRFDLSNAHEEVLLSIDPASSPLRWRMTKRGELERFITEDLVKAVCLRRYGDKDLLRRLSFPDSAHLDQSEVMNACKRLLDAIPESHFPLGQPGCYASAENKLRQLEVATELGFQVPATCYSNDPAVLAAFCREHRRVVVKPLSQGLLNAMNDPAEQKLMWCRAYDGAGLAARLEGVPRTQLYLQEAVNKVADWRIVVLPGRIFAFEIDTSTLAEEPDWRMKTMELPHREVMLQGALEAKLREFLKRMQLRAGSFDFGIPANGKPWFFECNPNGQWLWLEKLTGAPIARAMAEVLLEAARANSSDDTQ